MTQPALAEKVSVDSAVASKLLAVLGNHVRLHVLLHIAKAGKCVTEIAEELKLDVSAVSRALKALHAVDLVALEADKKKHFFRLSPSVQALMEDGVVHIRVCTDGLELSIKHNDR